MSVGTEGGSRVKTTLPCPGLAMADWNGDFTGIVDGYDEGLMPRKKSIECENKDVGERDIEHGLYNRQIVG